MNRDKQQPSAYKNDRFKDHINDDINITKPLQLEKIHSIVKYAINNLSSKDSYRNCKRHFGEEHNYSEISILEFLTPHSQQEALSHSLQAFDGALMPHQPGTLFNVIPPPLLGSIALSMLSHFYNPNTLLDITSGKFVYLEKKIIKFLSSIIGWNVKKSGGFFTFGGKATLMYGIKSALNSEVNQSLTQGTKRKIAVVCSEHNHYCIESICNFLGIGTNNCHRIAADSQGQLNLTDLYNKLTCLLSNKCIVPVVVVNCGSTINMTVDPIRKIKTLLRYMRKKFKLDYDIHMHCDTVVTWPWIFFKDIELSKSNMPHFSAKKIGKIMENLKDINLADSVGIDFHKVGLCPYVSSCFISKKINKIFAMHVENPNDVIIDDRPNEQCFVNMTFENSRPGNGIISAYYTLVRLGKTGITDYIAYLYKISHYFRSAISSHFSSIFEVINSDDNGYELVVYVKFLKSLPNYSSVLNSDENTKILYERHCEKFMDFIFNSKWASEHDVPMISFIPNYKSYKQKTSATAFLIYPNSLNITYQDTYKIIKNLRCALIAYMNSECAVSNINPSNKTIPK